MRTQLYVDPATRDLAIDERYNLRLTADTGEYLSQKIEARLRWYRGEWFLARSGGVPYFQSILGKADLNEVNALLLSAVSGIEGVAEVVTFRTTYDGALREYTVTFTVRAEGGEIVEGEVSI